MSRAVLHVDMDAFYASVEERDAPELRGRPLIVGGASRRGVVLAASYAVRPMGVHSAMPMAQALRLCPHAVVVRPRMDRYAEVSASVFEIFRAFTPLVEGLSLDEAFLDVTASQELMGGAVEIARRIKARIRECTGLTASVESGIGGFFGGSITVCRCSLRAASFGCECGLLGFFGVFSGGTTGAASGNSSADTPRPLGSFSDSTHRKKVSFSSSIAAHPQRLKLADTAIEASATRSTGAH